MAEENRRILPVNIEEEMKTAYIDYSMSVIVSRALPDVRDGLKPVHRRVLYGMDELGLSFNRAHKKSARVVGEVLGKYHPHGDSSVYDTMVRMAQEWSLRYKLVDGQGNFGSVDGDSPAAMRYTEVRYAKIAHEMIKDIDKETVDFDLNFDDSLQEPTVLPTRIPNLLVNGASGIAVGMATNMLPHNLTEVIDGTVAQIDNPDITTEELMQYIKAPDFPTGGIIYGVDGVKDAYETGRGRVVVRGRSEIEEVNGRERIIINEIPYQVNKANLIIKISELVKEERITGISDVNDESDRDGMRIVVDVKRDAMAQVILSKLYKYTPLQTSYGINNVALVKGRPRTLSLKEIISEYIDFRIEVVVRRTKYELRKAEERKHILEGLIIAVDNLDEVIEIIRSSQTVDEAQERLMSTFDLSKIQSKAILDMRLSRLTGLEIEKLRAEFAELEKKIAEYKEILGSETLQKSIVKGELIEVKEEFGDERKTEILFAAGEISIEEMIPNHKVAVSISHLGYIKRTKIEEYRLQSRGGKGSLGAKTRDSDFVEHTLVAHNHNYLLLFTDAGRCFWLRIFEIPEASKSSMGRVLQNIVEIPKEDKIRAYIILEDIEDEEFLNNNFITFCTKRGQVKKTKLKAYSRPRSSGINAITINEGDELLEAKLTNGNYHIMLANRNGRAVKFKESDVRDMGRTAAGVRGMVLDDEKDEVVGMIWIEPGNEEQSVMVVSEKGYGKRSDPEDYRLTKRGGKGVKTLNITNKTGRVVSLKNVTDNDDLMITNKSGVTIRMPLDSLRVMGRATQGVKLIDLNKKDDIADVTVIYDVDRSGSDEEE